MSSTEINGEQNTQMHSNHFKSNEEMKKIEKMVKYGLNMRDK